MAGDDQLSSPSFDATGLARDLVLWLDEPAAADAAATGGKGASLARLAQAGFEIPAGFCLTTAAYAAVAELAGVPALIGRQGEPTSADDRWHRDLAAEARQALLAAPLPAPIDRAIRESYRRMGERAPVAVRSSATAEDLPDASFAGQQDSYLNVTGEDEVVDAVRHCWASLWTERAAVYRARNGIDHATVRLAVVVQRMVPARTAGVAFSANPLTGRRLDTVVDAVPGLGDALVSGRVNPDHFVVDASSLAITERQPAGGAPCLTDEQVLEVARLARRVEAQVGSPQDLEWALDGDGRLWLLQARPITTLFPLPDPPPADPRVYLSLSTVQGVYQPFTPMGLEMFRLIGQSLASLLGKDRNPSHYSRLPLAPLGGRLYLDVTPLLRADAGRKVLLTVLGAMEPRTGEVLREVLASGFLDPTDRSRLRNAVPSLARVARRTRLPLRVLAALLQPDRARRRTVAEAERFLALASEPARDPEDALDRVERITLQLPPRVMAKLGALVAAGTGSRVLASKLAHSAGADAHIMEATRALPHNPTTEMNLELGAIAERLRSHREAASALRSLEPERLAARYAVGDLPAAVQDEVDRFLRRYGFRGVAEIDIGVPRWEDEPAHIFGILANLLSSEDPDAAVSAQWARASSVADEAAREAVDRIRQARGPLRARLLAFLLNRVRRLLGTRELPKFYAMAVMGACRRHLRSVGSALAAEGRLREPEDIFFLTLAEARAALAGEDARARVAERRARYLSECRRTRIPRIVLSDGTALYGDVQATGARSLAGSPASGGVYTGRARVVMSPTGARLEPGEVLVAPSTDPGWTPLFLTAGALVMEMGGLMSHGAIVAREYGIPAVVGAVGATGAIETGQVVTVDGNQGKVILDAGDETAGPPGV